MTYDPKNEKFAKQTDATTWFQIASNCESKNRLGQNIQTKIITHLIKPIAYLQLCATGQMAQVIRRLLLVREVWSSIFELIKSQTRC